MWVRRMRTDCIDMTTVPALRLPARSVERRKVIKPVCTSLSAEIRQLFRIAFVCDRVCPQAVASLVVRTGTKTRPVRSRNQNS